MGFKFWNFQSLIPTCFYQVNNSCHASPFHPHDQTKTDIDRLNKPARRRRNKKHHRSPIKVITSCGIVRVYSNPVRASTLMLEHSTHLLCRSDSLCIGQKIPSLSPKKKLKRGHNYFLLPKPYFQSTLTFASAAASFSVAAAAQNPNKSSTKLANSCRAFTVEKTKTGVLKIRVSDEFIAQLMTEQRMMEVVEEERVCSTPQLMKDYNQLVESSRQWRPKLEPIKEKQKKRFGDFRTKMKKKNKAVQLHHLKTQSAQTSPMLKSPRMLKNKIVRLRKK